MRKAGGFSQRVCFNGLMPSFWLCQKQQTSPMPEQGSGVGSLSRTAAKKVMPKDVTRTGISPMANICTLAAYEQARRALRGECEPMRKSVCEIRF